MTRGRIAGVPNQPKTPQRSIRISDAEWEAWKVAARQAGLSLTDLIRSAVNNRVKRDLSRRASDGVGGTSGGTGVEG